MSAYATIQDKVFYPGGHGRLGKKPCPGWWRRPTWWYFNKKARQTEVCRAGQDQRADQ